MELPELISRHYQVLEQFTLLTRDIERGKWDAGVTIMVNDGQVDVRGLGVVDTIPAVLGLILMATKSLPATGTTEIMAALDAIMQRSKVIETESKLWRTSP